MNEVTVEISPWLVVDILSVSTAFMLGLLFLTSKSKNNKANMFLGLFLWSLTSEVLASLLTQFIDEEHIYSTGMLTLPLMFLYVLRTLNLKAKPIYLIVILPFLLEFSGIVPPELFYLINIGLLMYMLKLLKNNEERLGDFYSDVENKTLSWLKNILYIYIFFHLFWMLEDLIGIKFPEIIEYFAFTSTVLTLVMIYWIGYNGFSQPEIFNGISNVSDDEFSTIVKPIEPEEKKVSESETASEESTQLLFEELTKKIKSEKLFVNSDVDLRTLSIQLNIKEKELSKLIKTHTTKNFYHFINQFRVEEFKKLLLTPKASRLSLLGLAEEAGFSSKSTFYSVFKTSEGITPKQYQLQLKKSE